MVGTPNYMAPEQAQGKSKEVGPAADVYGLGAILYEVLTGRPPFQGETILDTLLLVRTEEPLAPSRMRPKLPRNLDTICLKCLQKEPHKRYATAQALAEELRRFRDGEPIEARPVGQVERLRRWCQRNLLVAASLLGVMVSLLSGTVLASFFAIRATASAHLAVIQKGQADVARTQAEEEKLRAEEQRERAERLLYYGQIALAQREWQDNEVAHARELLDGCRLDLRGWEHAYLRRLFESNQRTILGHTRPVWSVAFSPDGKRIVSGGLDQTAKVWDAQTDASILTFKGHANIVSSVAFSPDGRRIVSGSWDHTVKVWDAQTGKQTLTIDLKGQIGPVGSVVFSPDGKRIVGASGSYERTSRRHHTQVRLANGSSAAAATRSSESGTSRLVKRRAPSSGTTAG